MFGPAIQMLTQIPRTAPRLFGMPEQVFQHGSPFPVFSSLQTPPAACPGPGRIPLALVCSLHRWVAGVHAATLSSRRPQSSMPRTAMPDGRMMEEWTGRVDSPRCLFYATFLRRSIQSWRPRTTIPDSNIVVGGVWSSQNDFWCKVWHGNSSGRSPQRGN